MKEERIDVQHSCVRRFKPFCMGVARCRCRSCLLGVRHVLCARETLCDVFITCPIMSVHWTTLLERREQYMQNPWNKKN